MVTKAPKQDDQRDILEIEVETTIVDVLVRFHQVEFRLLAETRVNRFDANQNLVFLNTYLAQPNIGMKQKVFEHWEGIKENFGSLYDLAIQHLIIPATSAPSERIFSVAGNVTTVKRTSLTGEHVNMIIFLNMNYSISEFAKFWEN
jgi:predicted transcriptional regulator